MAVVQANANDPLFTALAEQLKVPLLQIARLSETSDTQVHTISEHALMLVDAYVQSRTQNQVELLLEPLNTGAVLYDVAVALQPYARQANFALDIDQQGKAVPVMGHHQNLKTMLTLLGASLIDASAQIDNASRTLILGTHRSAKGTVVGAFSSQAALSQRALQLTRELHGRHTASGLLGQAGGAGLAIADHLSEQMSGPLKAYRHRSLTGIGALLLPSNQLQLLA